MIKQGKMIEQLGLFRPTCVRSQHIELHFAMPLVAVVNLKTLMDLDIAA